jgi:hypothetical protein
MEEEPMADSKHVVMEKDFYQGKLAEIRRLKRDMKEAIAAEEKGIPWRERARYGAKEAVTKPLENMWMVIGSAGLGAYLLNIDALNNISIFRENWWLKSAAVLGIGWWLFNRGNAYAQIVLALGAVSLVDAYKAQKLREPNKGKAGYDAQGYPLKDVAKKETSEPEAGFAGRYNWGGGGEDWRLREGDGQRMADELFHNARAA